MFDRSVNILKSNSFFLFGARGVGKTKLVESLFQPAERMYIDLLDPIEFETFSLNPAELAARLKRLKPEIRWVIIDEVQRVPELLNVVHQKIEQSSILFGLTGSSARKLKRGVANLLAGRAYTYHLFPLTVPELGAQFDLQATLEWGSLPRVLNIHSPEERKVYLQTYAHTYIREEVQAEQLVRRVEPFRKFLAIVAQSSGTIISYSNIARDVGTSDVTVRAYFEILEDTLLGFLLEPYHTSIRRRQRSNPKFYLFDTGVQRALSRSLDVPLQPQTYAFGRAFEHLVVCELFRRCSYARNDFSLSYLRTKDDAEIDLIVERPGMPTALVEIKSTERVVESDVASLCRFIPDFPNSVAYCFSLDPNSKMIQKVSCLHWLDGLNELLAGTATALA
jgi:predicted AAA+ superfamily ATPase